MVKYVANKLLAMCLLIISGMLIYLAFQQSPYLGWLSMAVVCFIVGMGIKVFTNFQ